MGALRAWPPVGPVEAGVAEGEDAAVGGHQPVAPCRPGWRPCPRWVGSGACRPSTRRSWPRRRRRSRRRRPPPSSRRWPGPSAMPTTGALRRRPPVDPQKGPGPEGEDAAVGGGQAGSPWTAAAGTEQAGIEPGRVGPPASPVSCGSWWNMGHEPAPDGPRPVGPGDLVVVDLPHAVRGLGGGDVAGQGDADGAVGVVGDQRRVLQAQVGAEVGDLGSRPPVEDQGPVDRGHDDVVVAVAGQIGGHHRSDDPADVGLLPDDLAGGGVEDVDRARAAGPWSVPSTTWSDPLPSTSDRAGDEKVLPSTGVDHSRWQWPS